jgi:hypothetical protein
MLEVSRRNGAVRAGLVALLAVLVLTPIAFAAAPAALAQTRATSQVPFSYRACSLSHSESGSPADCREPVGIRIAANYIGMVASMRLASPTDVSGRGGSPTPWRAATERSLALPWTSVGNPLAGDPPALGVLLAGLLLLVGLVASGRRDD